MVMPFVKPIGVYCESVIAMNRVVRIDELYGSIHKNYGLNMGINSKDDPSDKRGYRLVGDVEFESCLENAALITPVSPLISQSVS